MKRIALSFVVALSVLGACSDQDASKSTSTQASEAAKAIGDAGRETGQAVGSAARDVGAALAPAAQEAKEAGAKALDSTKKGLNDLTRSAACETAKAADDAAGMKDNC